MTFDQFTEGVEGSPFNKFYRKKKKDGSYRIIGKPNKPMMEIQERLLKFLKTRAPCCYSAAASKNGLGSVRNARVHAGAGSEFVFGLDLFNCFGNTNGRKLAEMISSRIKMLSFSHFIVPTADEWYAFLSKYVLMQSGGLIQGAKTSPLLLDWYCEMNIDRPLRKLLRQKTGKDVVIYTRYVDDLVFSSESRITHAFRAQIRKVIADAGYLENHRKTKVVQLSVHGTVRITGPRIGTNDHFGLPRKEVKKMERILDKALHSPLFCSELPRAIDGKLRYLLDVTRGKKELNALETRTIEMYCQWCKQNGIDAIWPTKILERKAKRTQSSHKKESTKRR